MHYLKKRFVIENNKKQIFIQIKKTKPKKNLKNKNNK